jgi:hypothetical protein
MVVYVYDSESRSTGTCSGVYCKGCRYGSQCHRLRASDPANEHLVATESGHPLPDAAPFQQPSDSEFLSAVSDFWFHSLWTAKHLRLGELWWAKAGCDWRLKGLLQQMIEWHAHAVRGPQHDTWMRGRFLEEWADPRAVARLPLVFAHYDRQDIARALWETMELFRQLALETAQYWRYEYPLSGDQAVTDLVRQLLVGIYCGNCPGEPS